jgi:hypothetical protein
VKDSTDIHEQRINSLLARKAAERGSQAEAVTTYTPLSALLRSEDGDDDEQAAAARSEVLGMMIDFTLQNGPHPASVLKNFYALVHALRPSAMPNWTCQNYADLFGETKAAHSWRVKQLMERFVVARGARPIRARFQKAASATKNYSKAQKGNRNRRHGLPRPDEPAA